MTTTAPSQAILNGEDAARYLGVARSTFNPRIAPTIPRIRLSAGRVGYRVDDLNEWLAARTEAPRES